MVKHIKWPSIKQYRNVVKSVERKACFKGLDNADKAIYDYTTFKPTLEFEGTVKLHGTNAAICVNAEGDVWYQSRERILSMESDNCGFYAWACGKTEKWLELVTEYNLQDGQTLAVFGEWCGEGIQKGVAISELPKMFVVIGVALVDDNRKYFKPQDITPYFDYTVWDFTTFKTGIDFNNPHEAQNLMNSITNAVESECPVGKSFGVSGIGEGVVWRCVTEGYESSDYWFKVKGEKHSKSKVKTLANVDLERFENIKLICDKLANSERLEQIKQQVFSTLNGGEVEISRFGDYIKAVMSDIFKEESDTISASGFSGKDLNSGISKLCRTFIMESL